MSRKIAYILKLSAFDAKIAVAEKVGSRCGGGRASVFIRCFWFYAGTVDFIRAAVLAVDGGGFAVCFILFRGAFF